MGLDQYLNAHKFVGDMPFLPEEQQPVTQRIVEEIRGGEILDPEWRVVKVTLRAITWRKANQIHKWFVDNVQGGIDDCEEYFVKYKHLEDLWALCDHVIETGDARGLKPQEGFFFGSTEIDKNYWDVLEATRTELDRLIGNKAITEWSFTYQASW